MRIGSVYAAHKCYPEVFFGRSELATGERTPAPAGPCCPSPLARLAALGAWTCVLDVVARLICVNGNRNLTSCRQSKIDQLGLIGRRP